MIFGRYFVVRYLCGEVDIFDDRDRNATLGEICNAAGRGGRVVKHTDDPHEAMTCADAAREAT